MHGNAENQGLLDGVHQDLLLGVPYQGTVTIPTAGTGSGCRDAFGPKSLFFCLCLDSPFYKPPPPRTQPVQFLPVPSPEPNGPSTYMEDEDLLRDPEKQPLQAPTKFEKVIEIILRLEKRGLYVEPSGMLVPTSDVQLSQITIFPDNAFQGYSLNPNVLLLSPDEDEMYLKLHASRKVLLKFAEAQGVVLNSHPYSFGGGAAMAYSAEQERKLTESLELFCEAFPEFADVEDDEGNKLSRKPEGFVLDVPDKMRLMTRLVREAWQFGGCGIQISEMMHRGILVRSFFPLHNKHYQEAYGLQKWASFGQALSLHPFYQVEDHVVKYFGEAVALYFVWIRKYTLFLRWIAVFGLCAGIMNVLTETDAVTSSELPISLVNMVFSIICCIWGVAWIFKWRRTEADFAQRWGQDAQVGQELVRDEFVQATTSPPELKVEALFRLAFDFPLTLRNLPDGKMLQLQDTPKRRMAVRYLISYPLILILSSGMVTVLYFLTLWRFMYPYNDNVSYASSVLTTVTGFLFGVLFDLAIGTLNNLENNRTDTEQEEQTISKSFLFYFLSYYFALFVIALWPSTVDNGTRLKQLQSQMIIITVVKPMVNNIVELGSPYFKAQLRVRRDLAGGSTIAGLCSMLRCEKIDEESIMAGLSAQKAEGRQLWREAQMEPYDTTSGDFLEITLQYGYMTMFAATFPWAAVLALLYNLLEIRIDAKKLLFESRRPVARPASTIGAWNGIFLFISSLSVVTNGYLIAVMSNAPERMKLPVDDTTRYKIFAITQYILIAGFFIIYAWWSGNSETYQKVKSKWHILSNRSTRNRLTIRMKEMARKRDDDPTV